MGEAINLVGKFKVDKVIFNCGDFNELEQELIKVLEKKKIPYYSCIKELNISDNRLYFLNNKDYGNENDNSSIIYTKLNNHKFLFMGDAGVEVEKDLIEKYNLQDIDVIKIGHHGSKTSSFKYFIPEVYQKNMITKLDGTLVDCKDKMLSLYIYNDYTNLNIKLLDEYNLNLKIFYNELPPLKSIIEEIPMDKLNIIVDQMAVIIEKTKEHKDFVFNIKNVKTFIDFSVQLILSKIKEI